MDANAEIILDFWFKEAGPNKWWKKNPDFDHEVRERFKVQMLDAAEGRLDHWVNDRFEALALVLLLDQFPRNAFRGTEKAFATDKKARFLSLLALERDYFKDLNQDQCAFMFMPLMHSENLEDQVLCCELFREMKAEGYLKYAKAHHDIIEKFGRFPHRNGILGRSNTEEEEKYLQNPGAGF